MRSVAGGSTLHVFCKADICRFQVRELGGIPLILNQCNIDDKNPCMMCCLHFVQMLLVNDSDTLQISKK